MQLTFRKYLHGVLNPEEFSRLEEYIKIGKNEKEISRLMKIHWDETMEGTWQDEDANSALFKQIEEAIETDRQIRVRRRLKAYTWSLRAAAVLLLAFIAGSIF